MRKYLIEYTLFLTVLACFAFLIILPYEIFRFNLYCTILPAIELIIIYYFATYRRVTAGQLFIVGFTLDGFYSLPAGANSLILISANSLLVAISDRFTLKEYLTNLIVFAIYAFLITALRVIIKIMLEPQVEIGINIGFYYLTTILIYPFMQKLITGLLKYVTTKPC